MQSVRAQRLIALPPSRPVLSTSRSATCAPGLGAGLQGRPRRRAAGGSTVVAAAAGEPFQPSRRFHKGTVEMSEDPPARLWGVTFQDVYYALNVGYWSLLLVSVLTGNDFVSRLVHFENYTTAMFASSAAFTLYHCARFGMDLRAHLQSEARKDWRQMLRYAWNAIFWLGFVLWYAVPPATAVAEYTGSPGAVMAMFGAALAVAAAMQAGMFSFMGSPSLPRRLQTGGLYALLRHPQALGNILFLIGFSAAGGALVASAVFALAFAFYCATVIPAEERMLKEAFGDAYEAYAKKTPRFAYALLLLVLVEVVLMWRLQPWAIPIDTNMLPRA